MRAKQLHQQVEEQITELIRSGAIKPGEQFPSERTLQEQLQVSRSVLREALRILEAKGLVVSSQGRRRYLRDWRSGAGQPGPTDDLVTQLEKVSVQEIYEIRLELEPAIARWAAERATAADIARLRDVLAELQQHAGGGAPEQREWRQSDFPFHLALAEASHNHVAVQILRTHLYSMRLYRPQGIWPEQNYRQLATKQTLHLWLKEHEELLDAIEARQPDVAAERMRAHLRQTSSLLQDGQTEGEAK